ncbi:MAG: Transcriptional repressor NrdR [Chloroflexi bacterium ADurb.Bin222]|nr:MAG: Transcriptional repressor NrdR [Chloroflexi bacterium ADurb.Bin222]
MKCPYCHSLSTKVVDTRQDPQGNMRRRRECLECDRRFSTVERPILLNPLVVKRDGRREEFDREKILSGLRIACARRPISAERLENLIDRVEYAIRQTGRAEVASHTIGDMVVDELRQIDEVAYIRYAIVYLGLSDLESIRREIDVLRSNRG